MLFWKKHFLLAIIFLGFLLFVFHWLLKYGSWDWIYKLESVQDVGSFSIVRDIRGEEPYMTIKMRCFYENEKLYGKTWGQVLDHEQCHEKLFKKCFSNRTVLGRHETHVLTFTVKNTINRCVCIDMPGWCTAHCDGLPIIKCCLDKGINSVLCRR